MIDFVASAGLVAFGLAVLLAAAVLLVLIFDAAVRGVKKFKRWFSGPWLL